MHPPQKPPPDQPAALIAAKERLGRSLIARHLRQERSQERARRKDRLEEREREREREYKSEGGTAGSIYRGEVLNFAFGIKSRTRGGSDYVAYFALSLFPPSGGVEEENARTEVLYRGARKKEEWDEALWDTPRRQVPSGIFPETVSHN